MLISDLSVKRPVFATVISLLLVTFGVISLWILPLRGYPDIDPPVVSIETKYPGASAAVVQNKVTLPLEDQLSGLDSLRTISSSSIDGVSKISIEFLLKRDIDAAANDVREAISHVLDKLPDEAKAPEVSKSDTGAEVIIWFTLNSDYMDMLELNDYANRYIVDRFKNVDGVARVVIGGNRAYVMKVSLDRLAMAARNITVSDVEQALQRENVEIPAGDIESLDREFSIRLARNYRNARDFEKLVIKEGDDNHLLRLGEVAKVEFTAADTRNAFRGNGQNLIGLGIVKQSKANSLQVSQDAWKVYHQINDSLPDGINLGILFDRTIFLQGAVKEVVQTLLITMCLVILVIYLFVGSWRATIIPAITVPVSLIAAFIFIFFAGFSINLLTLLALVLGIGLVVDDSIVVLENVYSRVERGEPPLLAAYLGTREVGFAVIATTVVLLAVFIPIVFIQGTTGKLFTEFALTLSAAVIFSSVIALSLTPMLCAKLLLPKEQLSKGDNLQLWIDRLFSAVEKFYSKSIDASLKRPLLFLVILLLSLMMIVIYLKVIPKEFDPGEDRGAFLLIMEGPEGSTYEKSRQSIEAIEQRLLPLVGGEDIKSIMLTAPMRGKSGHNTGALIVILQQWEERAKDAWQIIRETMGAMQGISEVKIYPWMNKALSSGSSSAIEFVIGGDSYEQLTQWRDILALRVKDNAGITGVRFDYKETLPQLTVQIDPERAADLGVSVSAIGRTLETMLGSRDVTRFLHKGEEYNVMLEGDQAAYSTRYDLENIYVRSDNSGELIPLSNLVNITERAGASVLNRYNRMRALTLSANLSDGYSLGEALAYLDEVVQSDLPSTARVDYKGLSLLYRDSTDSVIFVFLIALVISYLVLAAQFESFIHPLVVMSTVPLALAGAMFGLDVAGQTLNIYSQIGIIMLIGLAAKNGILIVEFANQLRDAGVPFRDSVVQASTQRLRPIMMTAITTVMGALPLIMANGAGAESRMVIGVVIFSGVLFATALTLIVVPLAYISLARNTRSPKELARELEILLDEH